MMVLQYTIVTILKEYQRLNLTDLLKKSFKNQLIVFLSFIDFYIQII